MKLITITPMLLSAALFGGCAALPAGLLRPAGGLRTARLLCTIVRRFIVWRLARR